MTIDLQLAHLLRCRITDRGVGDHDAASTRVDTVRPTQSAEKDRRENAAVRDSTYTSEVKLLHSMSEWRSPEKLSPFQLRSISEGFPTLRSARFSPIHRQRHLMIPTETTDALLGLTG